MGWDERREWVEQRRRRFPFFGDWYLRDMEEIMGSEFKELTEKAPRDLVREQTLPDGRRVKQWGPFVYGYSVRIGPDGKPQIREFCNVKPRIRMGMPHVEVKEQREPLVDMLEIDDEVRVIVELPGVEKQDIKLCGTENSLTISVDTPQRKYYKEVQLPSIVDSKQAKSTYKNGVLEITMPKRKSRRASQ